MTALPSRVTGLVAEEGGRCQVQCTEPGELPMAAMVDTARPEWPRGRVWTSLGRNQGAHWKQSCGQGAGPRTLPETASVAVDVGWQCGHMGRLPLGIATGPAGSQPRRGCFRLGLGRGLDAEQEPRVCLDPAAGSRGRSLAPPCGQASPGQSNLVETSGLVKSGCTSHTDPQTRAKPAPSGSPSATCHRWQTDLVLASQTGSAGR